MVYNTPYQIRLKPRAATSGTKRGATITNIAVSSRNVPMIKNDNCIMMSMIQGFSPICSVNRWSIAFTAPRPSKTAPKASAARIIHINMQEIASVFLTVASSTLYDIRPLKIAARNAAIAPIAEASTSEVQPFTNGTIMAANIPNGSIPALNKRSFSRVEILRSSTGNAGPREGLILQRTAM